jgi:hypothetical protein
MIRRTAIVEGPLADAGLQIPTLPQLAANLADDFIRLENPRISTPPSASRSRRADLRRQRVRWPLAWPSSCNAVRGQMIGPKCAAGGGTCT